MAGRKNHFIPRFLLQGFSQYHGSTANYIHAFHYSRGQIKANIKDFAAERFFYSERKESGDTSLDDEITAYEAKHAHRLYCDLISKSYGATVDKKQAAEFISHLSMRTAHIRGLFKGFIDHLAQPTRLKIMAEKVIDQSFISKAGGIGPEFEKLARDEYRLNLFALQGRGITEENFVDLAKARAQANLHIFQVAAETTSDLMEKVFLDRGAEVVRSGHVRALRRGVYSENQTAKLQEFSFKITHAPAGGTILPDCVIIAHSPSGEWLPLLIADMTKSDRVILPVSFNKILLGDRRKEKINLLTLNQNLASCSWDFYIGSSTHTSNAVLNKQVRSQLVTRMKKEADALD